MPRDDTNDIPALKKADIGLSLFNATDAAKITFDVVLTKPGISVVIDAVIESRSILHRMKIYTISAISITVHRVIIFVLITLIWKFDFSPFMILMITLLSNLTIMTISNDCVKPSLFPDRWKLKHIFGIGIGLGGYLTLVTILFFWIMKDTNFFKHTFHLRSLGNNEAEMTSALYLHISIMTQILIIVTRSRKWLFSELPGVLLLVVSLLTQMIETLIAVYLVMEFARIKGIGWGWAGAVWMDALKFYIRYSFV